MNNHVINVTIAIAFLNLYHAVSSVALYAISKFDADFDENIGDNVVHHFHRFVVYSIIDLLTALALLFLFFQLEQLTNRRNKSDSSEKNIDPLRPNHGTDQIRNILRHSDQTSEEEEDSFALKQHILSLELSEESLKSKKSGIVRTDLNSSTYDPQLILLSDGNRKFAPKKEENNNTSNTLKLAPIEEEEADLSIRFKDKSKFR